MASLGTLVLQLAVNSGTFSRDLTRVARQTDREFSSIARNARSMASVLNKALAIGAGFGLTRVLRQISEQTKKAGEGGTEFGRKMDVLGASFKNLLAVKGGLPEINKQLDEISKIFQSPAVVAAANSFFGAILSGALSTAKAIGEIVGGIRALGVQFGLFESRTQQEKIDRIDSQIAQLRAEALTGGGRGQASAAGRAAIEERRLAIEREITALLRQQDSVIAAGTTKFDRPTNITPFLPKPKDQAIRVPVEYVPRLRDLAPNALFAEEIEATRHDQFGKALLESTEHIAKQMEDVFEKPFDELSVYAEQAARNMQDTFADFLFDPFSDGLKGMLKGFVDVIRRMVAEAAAAKIFGQKSKGGFGLGGFITDLFGFQHGGSFTVPGSSGTDSMPVAFRATPGERVTVSPPGKGNGGVTIVQHNNFYPTGDTEVRAALPQWSKALVQASVAAVREEVRRGRL